METPKMNSATAKEKVIEKLDQKYLSDVESFAMNYLVEHGGKFSARCDLATLINYKSDKEKYEPKLFIEPEDPENDNIIIIDLSRRNKEDWDSLEKEIEDKIAEWHIVEKLNNDREAKIKTQSVRHHTDNIEQPGERFAA